MCGYRRVDAILAAPRTNGRGVCAVECVTCHVGLSCLLIFLTGMSNFFFVGRDRHSAGLGLVRWVRLRLREALDAGSLMGVDREAGDKD